jgi:hypothetical protein
MLKREEFRGIRKLAGIVKRLTCKKIMTIK